MLIKTQDYYLISRNQYGKNEPESQKNAVQANFNYNADKELINQIKIQLNLNRLDYLLNFNQKLLLDSANSYIDAWLNIDLRLAIDYGRITPQARIKLDKSAKRISEFKQYNDEIKLEILFAVYTQLEKIPTEPITNFTSKHGRKESAVELDNMMPLESAAAKNENIKGFNKQL